MPGKSIYVGRGSANVSVPELIAATTRVALANPKRPPGNGDGDPVKAACEQFEASRVTGLLEESGVSFAWLVSMQVAMARGGTTTNAQAKALDWLMGLLKGVVMADELVRAELGIESAEFGDTSAPDTINPFALSEYDLARSAG